MTSVTALPSWLARFVERARHHLSRVYQRTVPPYAAITEMRMNAWVAQAITAAVDLGVADALADGPLHVEELASRVDADAGALARLLRALIGRGVFAQRRDGRFALNFMAKTLRTSARFSMMGVAQMVGSPEHREHWSYLSQAVRTGKAVIPTVNGVKTFELVGQDADRTEIFNRAMAELTEMTVGPMLSVYKFDSYSTPGRHLRAQKRDPRLERRRSADDSAQCARRDHPRWGHDACRFRQSRRIADLGERSGHDASLSGALTVGFESGSNSCVTTA